MKEATTTTRASATTHVEADALVCPVGPRSTRFEHALKLLLATLREIFDESAYQRFLAQHHVDSSQTAYAAFLCEQEKRKARQPKCC